MGIFTIGSGVANLDTKSRLLDKHELQVNEYRSQIEELKSRKNNAQPTSLIDEFLLGGASTTTTTTKINELKSNIISLNNQLETDLKTVTYTLLQKSLILFCLWLGVSASAYFIGMIFNWIYRGFRPERQA